MENIILNVILSNIEILLKKINILIQLLEIQNEFSELIQHNQYIFK